MAGLAGVGLGISRLDGWSVWLAISGKVVAMAIEVANTPVDRSRRDEEDD
jgi:hypothetical protein